ncbi:Suppressor of Triplolethal [Carabus blaptoides fortunei]
MSVYVENFFLLLVAYSESLNLAVQPRLRCTASGINQLALTNTNQLSFPSEHGSNGCASFNFSISSTADMEGPGGSFECVQQCGPPRGALEVLGALPHKMRIHANDDVYEATRHRMTVAEENHKNKCTRVIKPNQTDIGRKVKVKQMPGRSIPIPKREPPPLSSSSSSSIRESLNNKPAAYNSSSSSSNAISNANSNSLSNSSSNKPPPPVHSSNNGLGSNHVTSSRPQNKPSSRDSDIMRRPIKERLIHLLALRPYKKPELVERINRDGREKNAFTTVLKQIAFMRDNTYHLHQHMWNDVNDEWPYYTDQEKQLLKRRKPQNLTPPGSSDGGSSGSGQSPTSTHPGSPPPPVTSSVKRPGYYDGADGLPTKRPRISHYRKPEPASSYNRPAESNSQRRPVTDSRDASNMNPRSREGSTNGYSNSTSSSSSSAAAVASNGATTTTSALANISSNINSNNTSSISSDKRQFSDDETEPVIAANRKRACDSHSVNYNAAARNNSDREKTFLKENNSICSSPNKPTSAQHHQQQQQQAYHPPEQPAPAIAESRTKKETSVERSGSRCRSDNNDVIVSSRERDRDRSERDRDRGDRDRDRLAERERDRAEKRWNKVSSTTHNGNSVTRVSPDSQADRIMPADSGPPSKKVESKSEFPDYLTEYTTIKNVEQRKRYKADFNADYAEYRDLHAVVETVSRRFAQLEERLKQEDQSSQAYKDIKKQIVRDYKENQRDDKYQKSKRRFQYLHDKLSHIKRLVLEYDQQGGNTQPSGDHSRTRIEIDYVSAGYEKLRFLPCV